MRRSQRRGRTVSLGCPASTRSAASTSGRVLGSTIDVPSRRPATCLGRPRPRQRSDQRLVADGRYMGWINRRSAPSATRHIEHRSPTRCRHRRVADRLPSRVEVEAGLVGCSRRLRRPSGSASRALARDIDGLDGNTIRSHPSPVGDAGARAGCSICTVEAWRSLGAEDAQFVRWRDELASAGAGRGRSRVPQLGGRARAVPVPGRDRRLHHGTVLDARQSSPARGLDDRGVR